MRWEDERYVRVYTRDTITWKMLPWQGKALLALLFRKVDRAGLIDIGEYGPDGLAALVDLPVEVVTEGLASLIRSKTVQWANGGTVLFLPNFLSAQEAHQSDAQRKRDQRERVVAKATLDSIGLSHGVTESHETGQSVTKSDEKSQNVTSGHPYPNLPDPSLTNTSPSTGVLELLPVEEYKPDLDAAYALFPRKEGKTKGMTKLKREITTPAKYERLVSAIRNYARHVSGRPLDKVKQFDSFVTIWQDYADGVPFEPSTTTAERPRPRMQTAEQRMADLLGNRDKGVA